MLSCEPMTSKRLKDYLSIKRRVESMRGQLEDDDMVTDVVRGSEAEFPYTQGRVTVKGLSRAAVLARIRHKLDLDECEAVERYINSVQDSHVRAIMGFRYLDGMSWRDVAAAIGGNTEDSVRKACHRYVDAK